MHGARFALPRSFLTLIENLFTSQPSLQDLGLQNCLLLIALSVLLEQIRIHHHKVRALSLLKRPRPGFRLAAVRGAIRRCRHGHRQGQCKLRSRFCFQLWLSSRASRDGRVQVRQDPVMSGWSIRTERNRSTGLDKFTEGPGPGTSAFVALISQHLAPIVRGARIAVYRLYASGDAETAELFDVFWDR